MSNKSEFLSSVSKEEFESTAVRVSNVSIIGNTVLTVFKLAAGIIAHSGAMVTDAIHSASDVLSSFIVIIGVKLSVKDSDEDHPYGHERFESVAAIILAVILCITGLFIGHTAIEKLSEGSLDSLQSPGVLALVAAAVSILCKEAMYWYTRLFAKKLDSGALMAEAWHHRSDALSSIGALVGIAGARLGFGVGCASLISDLNAIKYSTNPYNINRMTMAAGIGALSDEEYTRANCRKIIENREYTCRELKKLGFEYLESGANFVFAKHPKIGGQELYETLKEHGILIRHFNKERIKDYLRITIGSLDQMQALIDTLIEII